MGVLGLVVESISICALPAHAPSILSTSPGSTESKVMVPVFVVDLLVFVPLVGISVTVRFPLPRVNLMFIVVVMSVCLIFFRKVANVKFAIAFKIIYG